jgi:G3E family GTPase
VHDEHCGHDHHGHDDHHDEVETHDEDIKSISLTAEGQLHPDKFNGWINEVLRTYGQDILRTKGILNLAGSDKRYVFQAVHMVSEGAFTGAWPAKDNRRSRLVFIGRNLETDALRKGFDACAI